MRLTFQKFDGRSHDLVPVMDQDTNVEVGVIQSWGSTIGGGGSISISLFGGRYKSDLHSQDEIRGFLKGVQTVLASVADLASTKPPKSVS